MSEASFLLWNYYLEADCALADTGTRCHFDVTPAGFLHLADGTPELIGSFLNLLGVDRPVAGWEIRPFISHYFSGTEASCHTVEDRYPLAWEVLVTLKQPTVYRPPALLLGINAVSDAWDATWSDQDDGGGRSACRHLLIANLIEPSASDIERFTVETRSLCRQAHIIRLHADIVQCRLDLGRIRLPQEESVVRDALQRCRDRGALVHVDQAMRYEAQRL